MRDDALEGEIELEALRKENEELRRMLGISEAANREIKEVVVEVV